MTEREVNRRSPFLTRFKGKEIEEAPVESLINPYNLYSVLNLPQRKFIGWLQQRCLLSRFVICPICHKEMKFSTRNSKIDGFVWKCCRRERSIRKNSFFEKSQYPLQDILNFMVHFALGENLKGLSTISGMDYKSTALDWANFCRDVCRQFVHEELPHIKLKGIIEVDESLFGRRVKHHRGNPNKGIKVWIVGLVERDTDRLLMFPVNSRDAETLEKIITDNVQEGATIYSDGWAAYSRLNALGFRHFVVNHNAAYAVQYVDESTGEVITVHTNRIEGAWKHAKDHFKRINGTSLANFEAHLAEILWRNWARGSNIVENFLSILRTYYLTVGPPRLNAPIPLFPYWNGTDEIFSDSVLPQEGVDVEAEATDCDYLQLSKSWLPETPDTPDSNVATTPEASPIPVPATTPEASPIPLPARKRKPGFLPDPIPQRPLQSQRKPATFTVTQATSTPIGKKPTPKMNFSIGDLFSDDSDDFQVPSTSYTFRPVRSKPSKKATQKKAEKKKTGHGVCPTGFQPLIRGQRQLTEQEKENLDQTPLISDDESFEANLLTMKY